MRNRLSCIALSAALMAGLVIASGSVVGTAAGASDMPSGEVMFGHASFDATSGTFVGGGGTIEPAYDLSIPNKLIYLQTPIGSQVHPAQKIDPSTGLPVNVAPLYIPVYPLSSTIDVTLNCMHVPADNCPDHGPEVAGAAMSIMPSVYGGGVLGHDHLAGIASTGGDFNVLWEPVLVLFTNSTAANEHITTLAQINSDLSSNDVITVLLPQLDFNCAPVSAAAYERGTPAPTVGS